MGDVCGHAGGFLDVQVTPVDMQVTPVDVQVTPVEMQVTPVGMQVTPVGTEVTTSLHSWHGGRRTAMDFEAGDTFDVAAAHFASQSTVGSLWKGGAT